MTQPLPRPPQRPQFAHQRRSLCVREAILRWPRRIHRHGPFHQSDRPAETGPDSDREKETMPFHCSVNRAPCGSTNLKPTIEDLGWNARPITAAVRVVVPSRPAYLAFENEYVLTSHGDLLLALQQRSGTGQFRHITATGPASPFHFLLGIPASLVVPADCRSTSSR